MTDMSEKNNERDVDQSVSTRNNKKKKSVTFTGFRKAIPVMLIALAIFTALCFVSSGTGALGRAISNVLRGLFSIGAYTVPALILIHAFFYPSDLKKNRVWSRIIFSFVAVISISAITHAFTYFKSDLVFSAADFYSNGIKNKGGGFVGGSVAYGLTWVFGKVGFTIISCLVFALYIIYFFGSENKAFSRFLLRILNGASSSSTKKKEKKIEKKGIRDEKKAEKEEAKSIEERKANQELLLEDEFFAADNGMRELTITELGVNDIRSDAESEQNPTLHDKVFHKSAVDADLESPSANRTTKPNDPPRRRPSMDYGDFGAPKSSYRAKGSDDIIYGEPAYKNTYNESAESVFSRDFDAFDFKMNESLATRQSSRTAPKIEDEGVSEFSESISNITEKDIEMARRKADFEMRKQAALEAQRRYAEERARTANPNISSYQTSEPKHTAPTYTSPQVEYIAPKTENTSYQNAYTEPSYTKTEPVIHTYEPPKASENVYASEEPAGDSVYTQNKTETIVDTSYTDSDHEEKYDSNVSFESERAEETPLFKDYTPDSSMEFNFEMGDEEETIKLTRSVLDSSFESEKEDTDIEDSPMSFEFESEEDEEESEEAVVTDMPEEESGYYEPIPEEEQNPEILEYRKMFSFFNEEEKTEPIETPSADVEEDEDTPPFDRPTAQKTPAVQKETKIPEPVEDEEPERPDYSDYKLPPVDLLLSAPNVQNDDGQAEEINENADNLVNTLQQFGVRVSVKGVDRGPRITRYEIVPAMGVKVQSVMSLYNDIVLNLGAEGVRMEAPIPGKKAIGVEIPNKNPATVFLRELVETENFKGSKSKTLACLGKDVTGNPVFEDIAKMPHVLVAGATGMGKSVCINAILISILYKATPDDVRFIMIDPKKVEFKRYNGIPHLLVPVVTDVKQAAGALMWAVEQMEKRYDLMEELSVSKLDAYNELVRENPSLGTPLPKIIIVIDELNDIMIQVRKPAEDLIMSIAQKARAAGIHLIIGTQRPSVNVVTGTIKANIPSRISCKVASFQDSKTILEQSGAEKLLNNGDMLYITSGTPKPIRVQGAFVSDGEVAAVMRYLKSQAKGDVYDAQALEDINRAAQKCSKGKGGAEDFEDDSGEENAGAFNDPQFLEAVEIAIRAGKISTAFLQRKQKIGYGKAARFIDLMEEQGIVSGPNAQKARDVLISSDEWHEILSRRSLD